MLHRLLYRFFTDYCQLNIHRNGSILEGECIERGSEKPLSFWCLRVGLSVQCERALEYIVKPLNMRTNQISVVSDTMVVALERFLS